MSIFVACTVDSSMKIELKNLLLNARATFVKAILSRRFLLVLQLDNIYFLFFSNLKHLNIDE
jgi:hypothetical protein